MLENSLEHLSRWFWVSKAQVLYKWMSPLRDLLRLPSTTRKTVLNYVHNLQSMKVLHTRDEEDQRTARKSQTAYIADTVDVCKATMQ